MGICTDSHFTQFVDALYLKWLEYEKSHNELEKFIAIGSVVPTFKAHENGHASCNGFVRYGKKQGSTEKWTVWRETQGSFHCSNAVFGDAWPGVRKQCDCVSHSTGKERVASEWEYATCDGLVTYGKAGKWTTRYTNGRFRCSNDVFGDPYPGVGKECWCETFR